MLEAVVCPACGRRAKVEVERLGQGGICAGCGANFQYRVEEPVYGRDGKIKLSCPTCGTKYRLKPEMAGRLVQCNSCHYKMAVPGRRVSGGPPAPRPPLPPPPAEPDVSDILRRIDRDDFDDVEEAIGPAPAARRPRRGAEAGETGWKWWAFVIAGVLIIGFSVWQLLEGEPILKIGGRRRGPIGGLILGTLSVLIGIWSRPTRRDEP